MGTGSRDRTETKEDRAKAIQKSNICAHGVTDNSAQRKTSRLGSPKEIEDEQFRFDPLRQLFVENDIQRKSYWLHSSRFCVVSVDRTSVVFNDYFNPQWKILRGNESGGTRMNMVMVLHYFCSVESLI